MQYTYNSKKRVTCSHSHHSRSLYQQRCLFNSLLVVGPDEIRHKRNMHRVAQSSVLTVDRPDVTNKVDPISCSVDGCSVESRKYLLTSCEVDHEINPSTCLTLSSATYDAPSTPIFSVQLSAFTICTQLAGTRHHCCFRTFCR